METTTENIILNELRAVRTELHDVKKQLDDFREENDKRWEKNDKKLDGMNTRIKALEEGRTKDKKDILAILEEGRAKDKKDILVLIEEGRIKDRRDILAVLDTMQKSISNQFTEMKEYMDSKFEKIFALQRVNDVEHEEFKKMLYGHNKRLDFHNARLNYLEKWKQDFDMGEYTAV